MEELTDSDFENAEEVDFESDWQPLDAGGTIELDQEWVTYLAQTEPEIQVEGYDPSISDFEDEGETQYA